MLTILYKDIKNWAWRYRPEITATQNVKGGSQIQDLPGLQNKFKTILAS